VDVGSLAELNAMVRRLGPGVRRPAGRSGRPRSANGRPVSNGSVGNGRSGVTYSPTVHGRISVRTNLYSVPVRVRLHASELVVYGHRVKAARHQRCSWGTLSPRTPPGRGSLSLTPSSETPTLA
jgi:hypothetical protein